MRLTLTLPLHTRSLANMHEHWRHRARRAKHERLVTRLAWTAAQGRPLAADEIACVSFVRLAPRDLDSDNLPPAFKSIRDELAACLGVDDRSRQYVWAYDQRRGKPGEYSVLVEVELRPAIAVERVERAG